MVYNYCVIKLLTYFNWRKKCPRILRKMKVLVRNLLFQKCANLVEFIKEIIFSNDFLHRHRKSEKDFTRQRKLPFPTLIVFLIDSKSISGTKTFNRIKEFFPYVTKLPEQWSRREVTRLGFGYDPMI